MTKTTTYLLGLWAGISLYTITSYLIVLRDPFLLERLAISLKIPTIETGGLFLAQLLHVNFITIPILAVSFLVSFFFFIRLFYLGSKIKLKKPDYLIWLAIIITVYFSFPALSTDVFDYNNTNKVTYQYKANPWLTPARQFPQDPEIYIASWLDRASVYPPTAFVTSSLVYFIFGTHLTAAVLGFKALALTLYSLITYSLHYLLPKKTWLVLFFALNPLVLIEFIGNAHNDLLMAFFALLGLSFFIKNKPLFSGINLGLGFLAKFTIILYLPLWIMVKLKQAQYRHVALITATTVVTLSLGLLFMGDAYFALRENLNFQLDLYHRSLPLTIRNIFHFGLNLNMVQANQVQKIISAFIFGAWYLLAFTKINEKNLVGLSALTIILYLLIVSPMLQPWYLAWFLPLVPLAHNSKLSLASIIFSFSALSHYFVYFISLYLNPLSPYWQTVLYLVMSLPGILILTIPGKWYTRLASFFKHL